MKELQDQLEAEQYFSVCIIDYPFPFFKDHIIFHISPRALGFSSFFINVELKRAACYLSLVTCVQISAPNPGFSSGRLDLIASDE